MQAGAFDFITKPWNNAALLQRIETALQLSGRNIFTCLSRVKPSSPVVERVKFISNRIKSGAMERTTSIACLLYTSKVEYGTFNKVGRVERHIQVSVETERLGIKRRESKVCTDVYKRQYQQSASQTPLCESESWRYFSKSVRK